MNIYKNKKVLVIGLARTGLSAVRLLARLGAKPDITDMKPESALTRFSSDLPEGVGKLLGGHDGVSIADYDLAVISPGVPWDSPLPVAIREANISLISEIELAFTLIDAPMIAVTGANGKTTTTTLIGEMLKAAGFKTYVGGNIGAPLCDAVDGDYDKIVVEVSSFQLEGIKTFKPKIGLILNITPDHLDRHKTFQAYAALKARIFENQADGDTLILNAEDAATRSITGAVGASLLRFAVAPHDTDGIWVEEGKAISVIGNSVATLFDVSDLKIAGEHNVENALAASLAAMRAGVAPDVICDVIKNFKGLPHRMELVATVDGIMFINDSKGTNIDATIKSLAGFDKDVFIIAGGSSKGAGFAPLARAIKEKAKGAALIGVTAGSINEELGAYPTKRIVKDFTEALAFAKEVCAPGDTVLLSPACASFDMFKSYEHRGDQFRNAVMDLKEAGDAC